MKRTFWLGQIFLIFFFISLLTSLVFFNYSQNFYKTFWGYFFLICSFISFFVYFGFSYSEWSLLLKQKKRIRQFFLSFFIMIVLGIFIFLYGIATYYPVKFDLTRNKYYTISKQTQDIIEKLDTSIYITMWYDVNHSAQRNQDLRILLDSYQNLSRDYIFKKEIYIYEYPQIYKMYSKSSTPIILTIKHLNLPAEISLTRWEKIKEASASRNQNDMQILEKAYFKSSNAMVLKQDINYFTINQKGALLEALEKHGYIFEHVNLSLRDIYKQEQFLGENKITNAILALTKQIDNTLICNVQGHQEKSFFREYKNIKDFLELEAYSIREINLLNPVDKECDILMIAGPKRPFYQNELNHLENYSEREASKIIFLLDPEFQYLEIGKKNKLDFNSFFKKYSVKVGDGFLYDPQNLQKVSLIYNRQLYIYNVHKAIYASHPIVDLLIQNQVNTFFLGLLPLSFKKNDQYNVQSFLNTSSSSWIEKSFSNDQVKNTFSNDDQKGPHSFGLTIEAISKDKKKDKKKRVIVIGDSDFIVSKFAEYENGKDLFLNSLAWISQKKDQITIRPKINMTNKVIISNKMKQMLSFILIFIPILIAFLWIYIPYQRQKRFTSKF